MATATKLSKHATNATPRKPSLDWIVVRLTTMANLRRSTTPEHIEEFASSLVGFSEPIIDRACTLIERSPRGERETAFPELGRLLDECRAAAQTIREDSHTWSLSRYIDLCEAYPARSYAWIAWKNQKAAGTLICPQWCDYCEGQRYLVTIDANGDRWARRCPHCREGAA
jgi:hypothetical protein